MLVITAHHTAKPLMDDPKHHKFLQLMGRHELRLTACVHALVPENWHDAVDVLQETKVKVWDQLETYEEGTDFGAWICTIARYEVRTYRKRQDRHRTRFSEPVLDLLADRVVEPTGEDADNRTAALAGCVRALDRTGRELLNRCYTKGQKVADIATETGRTAAAVYTSLSRIRRRLLRCVEERLAEESHE